MFKNTTQQIRDKFIDFFKKNNHTHVKSSPLIPHNDPSLMFVNSGMVQFKDVFTGFEEREYTRATSSQKSVRAGGKHNDLENVGYTARHHTFFEMLGNFSFGDYFKEEAIYYAWTLLTKEFALPKNKLYVTVYHTDDEAVNYWKKIANLSDDRIIKIKTNDNFWSMGDIGPCGPCSEIFYDHGEHIKGGLPGTPEEDGDRFVEIWNLVFMQYEQVDKENRILLPNKSVDTGMGLERMAAVLQGVHDNYDIDVFKEIILYTEALLKVPAKGDDLVSYRVIADHLRSSAFLIADGVMPSNEGRGYVLRRIMRRAMRHLHQLGSKDVVMYKLLPCLINLFGHAYDELNRAEELISSVLRQEEERFKNTLDRGISLLKSETKNISSGGKLAGEIAFKLYDTYGFPLDLTEDILKKQNLTVDQEGFDKEMNIQKEKARKSWSGSGESKTSQIWFDILSNNGATEFLGYALNDAEAITLKLVTNGKTVEQIAEVGTKFTLIANQTSFYGESGGQMGDIGTISSPKCRIKVIDTLKYLGKIIGHICELEEGIIHVNDQVKLSIDVKYRHCLKMHHTATHILHAVLREILGKHVTQKGSLVAYDRLRFDISHHKALNREEIRLIENKVNNIIMQNSKVNTDIMSADQAIEAGAMALFGEKYDSEVRVVSLGADSNIPNVTPYSFELCGGTHVSRTGDIGAFKIISEGAIAAGVRRIEAVCGEFAFNFINKDEDLIAKIEDILRVSKQELLQKIESIVIKNKQLEAEKDKIQLQQVMSIADEIEKKSVFVEDVNYFYYHCKDINPKVLRSAAENIIKNTEKLVLVLVLQSEQKVSIVVASSKDVEKKYKAGYIAGELAKFVGGNGGGKSNLAQAGGSDISKVPLLKYKVQEILKEI